MKTYNSFLEFENIPCGVFVLDKKFNVAFWNNEMTRLFDITSKEIIGKNISRAVFLDPKSNPYLPLNIISCIDGSIGSIFKSAIIRNSNNIDTLVFISAKFFKDDQEKRMMAFVTDISSEITCKSTTESDFAFLNDSPISKIIGNDERFINLHRLIELASESTANVMIIGESGTGKELVSNAIHYLSDRKDKAFIKVNCSALSESLLESELFGHVKGSYTGAYKDKIGKFEAANGGTIFLDEIGEISPMIQVKLLRVIQERVIERVGDNKEIKVDIRIIAATNRNLRDLVTKGIFREDLFYRLNVFPIYTVPLRDHKTDIPLLVSHFIEKFNQQTGKSIKGMTEDAFRIIMDYCFPGNVRELENAIEHAFVLCNKPLIDYDDLPQEIRSTNSRIGLCAEVKSENYFEIRNVKPEVSISTIPFKRKLITKEVIENILQHNNENRTETAKILGISRVALWKKMKKFGME
ncbi:MAG: sigma 54-interacting transcriptional regulator [Bacteroidetes bacterium]|nr:sigma 54-interacting transcriptional regulator [Bacteroidota bacterium]